MATVPHETSHTTLTEVTKVMAILNPCITRIIKKDIQTSCLRQYKCCHYMDTNAG
ncbi:MAG TPA: hypothetical protein ACHBX0_00025 [Arsenophonus sp.]